MLLDKQQLLIPLASPLGAVPLPGRGTPGCLGETSSPRRCMAWPWLRGGVHELGSCWAYSSWWEEKLLKHQWLHTGISLGLSCGWAGQQGWHWDHRVQVLGVPLSMSGDAGRCPRLVTPHGSSGVGVVGALCGLGAGVGNPAPGALV